MDSTPWAPFTPIGEIYEDASLYIEENGTTKVVFTHNALQNSVMNKEFVNERLVRRIWGDMREARRFADLDQETRDVIPIVVLTDSPEASVRRRVMTPEHVFLAVSAVRTPGALAPPGIEGFVCAFCALCNSVLAASVEAADSSRAPLTSETGPPPVPPPVSRAMLLCAPAWASTSGDAKGAPVAPKKDGDYASLIRVGIVRWDASPEHKGWATAVAKGNTVTAVLAFGSMRMAKPEYLEEKVLESVKVFFKPIGVSVSVADGVGLYEDSTAADACPRACAAAWAAACFRDHEFVSVWHQTQWPSDGFVAGAVRCDEAARMALAHAVVGCSSALKKTIAARKVLAESIRFETKARRVKLAAVAQETDARRLAMADAAYQAEAARMAIAGAPDQFPILQYPHNKAHHMYLWTPNL